jgi:hypothetical protein
MIYCPGEDITHDAHKKRSHDIAVSDKEYFWQPPSKPRDAINANMSGCNALDKRPNPIDLIISIVNMGRTRGKISYLFVQSDDVVIQEQQLVCTPTLG